MEENRTKELEQLLKIAEILDWNYVICKEPETTCNKWRCEERNYVELEKYSPAGEDFSMVIDFDIEDPVDSFLEDLEEYAKEFDIDEHVEIWIPERGKGGCPSSISELVKDAKEIKDMIAELYKKLHYHQLDLRRNRL